MILTHDAYNERYRRPFGAAPCGTQVTLTLKTSGAGRGTRCSLELVVEDGDNTLLPMPAQYFANDAEYSITVTMPEKPGLVFYRFRLDTAEGTRITVGCDPNGSAMEEVNAAGWQITVYEPASVPQWYKNAVAYQIFPDRFCRGEDYLHRWEAVQNERAGFRGPSRELVEDWDTLPYYNRAADGRIDCWNFWGGTAEGIAGKLGYLRSLGVSLIYLNPIFKAASNHRYDTADYFAVDPGFGDEAGLQHLIDEARKLGISIILDGVFNHVGADSRYFDRFSNYGTGAYSKGEKSDYYDWFRFSRWPDEYECWWGVKDLPCVEERHPDFLETVCGENGVIRYWIRRGIKGWRLDVADELPDSFIREIRAAARAEDPEAIIIGEVWEDASNKVSYGQRRRYFAGDELDGVMNYPLRTAVLDFLCGNIDAVGFAGSIEVLKAHYPKENFFAGLNLIGSHDRTRALTLLGDAVEPPEAERRDFTLSPDKLALGIRRMKLASLLQFTVPGVPCIYYGDEAGMQGFSDPYNRGPFPWGNENKELTEHYRLLGHLRSQYRVLREGGVSLAAPTPHVAAVTRRLEGEEIILVVNRGVFEHESVAIPAKGEAVDLLTGQVLTPEGGRIHLQLEPTSAVLLHIGGAKVEGLMPNRASGILCHLSSIPRDAGESPLEERGREFVDFLAAAGQKLWQILPLNPVGIGDCPYASPSVFAGESSYCPPRDEDWQPTAEEEADFERFCAENEYWLDDHAMFMLYREMYGTPWQSWPVWARERQSLREDARRYAQRLREIKWQQYDFFTRWGALRRYANEKGVKILGDIPLYAAPDSADVWAHREFFALDEAGNNALTGGAPGDYFNPEGQSWGSPVYNWAAIEKDGWRWWKERFAAALKLYDWVRFDHFRGFAAYYTIPGEAKPNEGSWAPGPGKEFFEIIADGMTKLPVIAEDLGHLDSAVLSLKKILGFAGMLVWQFSRDEMRAQSEEEAARTVYYSGTHDNQTLVGWYMENANVPELVALQAAERAMNEMSLSPAAWVIAQMQDVLGLDDSARMNMPGVAEGNWGWRCPRGALNPTLAQHLRRRAQRSGRV